jgi:uncharacterized OB-fold protein
MSEKAGAEEEVHYSADHVLEYPYVRSVGPVIGAFLTGYDPETGEETTDIVDVGPEGTVTSWSWVPKPLRKHPLQTPFAWVLVKFDGADTSFLHVLPAADPSAVSTGMRVRPEFIAEADRVGHVNDIRHFVAVGGAA